VDAALTAAGGNAKKAILMLLTGAGPGEADEALAGAGGHLRAAMARTSRNHGQAPA
jgi:N-acetylmuramic acid 6-phosphate (MurNAc-6-P) etherase